MKTYMEPLKTASSDYFSLLSICSSAENILSSSAGCLLSLITIWKELRTIGLFHTHILYLHIWGNLQRRINLQTHTHLYNETLRKHGFKGSMWKLHTEFGHPWSGSNLELWHCKAAALLLSCHPEILRIR